jgi:heptosyltransferase-3
MPTRKESWKKKLLQHWLPFDDLDTHTVRTNLALADKIGASRRGDVVVAWSPNDERSAKQFVDNEKPFAVLHTYPKFNYKMWHAAGWAEVARCLAAKGIRVVLSGGNDARELAYVEEVARSMPVGTTNTAGKLTLGASASLVSRAQIYVGPDTAMTHIATALGVPTIALYGPTNCVKWGPWPKGHAVESNPWRRLGTQRRANVVLLQGPGACVPCHLEGCDRHTESYSDCLQQLSATQVIAAIETMLNK